MNMKNQSASRLLLWTEDMRKCVKNLYISFIALTIAACMVACGSSSGLKTARITSDDLQGRGIEALYNPEYVSEVVYKEIEVDGLKENLDMQLFRVKPKNHKENDDSCAEFIMANNKSIYWLSDLYGIRWELKEEKEVEKYICCTDLDQDGKVELCFIGRKVGGTISNYLFMYERSGNSIELKQYIPFDKIDPNLNGYNHNIHFLSKNETYGLYDEDTKKEYQLSFEKKSRFRMYDNENFDVSINLQDCEENYNLQKEYEERWVKKIKEYGQ